MEDQAEYKKMAEELPDLDQAIEMPDVHAEKIARWKKQRAGKITSSILPALMCKGRGSEAWGKTAIDALYAIKYEQRTGLTRESKELRQFEWGHEQEGKAIEWLREAYILKDCQNDFPDIVFNEPMPMFGDSPDFYLLDQEYGHIKYVGEIKSPVDQCKIEKLREITEITEEYENYWQILGHFIGCPEAEVCWLVIWDGFAKDGRIIEVNRRDHLNEINTLKIRIMQAANAVKLSLEGKFNLSEINKYFK